jgi:hypothetical protein
MKLISLKSQAMVAAVAALSLVSVLVGANYANAALTLGSTTVASDGVLAVDGAAASANTLFAANTTGTITVGAGLTTGTLTVGSATQTGNVVIRGGLTGGANTIFNNSTTSTIAMGAALTTGTLTLGNASATGATTYYGAVTSGANGLFTNATTSAVNIATGCTTCAITVGGAGANVITIGDVTGATSGTTLIGGSVTTNGAFNFAVDAGSTDDYAVTLSPAPTAYTTGMMVVFTANTANTTGATLNVNTLGAKALVKGANAALATNDIIVGRTYIAVYDGTQFDLINPAVQ